MVGFSQLLNLAQNAEAKGQYAQAATYFEQLAQIRSSYYGNAGWSYLACADWKKSQEMFDKIGGAPTFLKSLYQALKNGDIQLSSEIVEKLLQDSAKEKDCDFAHELNSLKNYLNEHSN